MPEIEVNKTMISRVYPLIRPVFLVFLAFSTLILSSCESEIDNRSALAIIDSVDVEASGQPAEFYAVVNGYYPDNCSTTGDIVQRTQGQTIRVTVYTSKTDDAICETVLTPFTERIRLQVDDLSPGQYTIDVNGSVNSFTIS